MNLNEIFFKAQIDGLTYDMVYTERPLSKIIDFDWKYILKAPLKNSDKQTLEELKLISTECKKRSQKDIDLIYSIDTDLDTPFINLLNSYKLTYPWEYINLFYDIVHPLLLNTKAFWNRPRPSQLADLYNIDINVIVTDTIYTASYPSGHTVYSKLVANILHFIYPQIRINQLDNIVTTTAKARIMQGVHYPSDNKASLIFSDTIFNKLNPKLERYIS
jgi:hypothetical protein